MAAEWAASAALVTGVRFVLTTVAADLPALVCIAIGLALGVALVEMAVVLWHRVTGPRAGE